MRRTLRALAVATVGGFFGVALGGPAGAQEAEEAAQEAEEAAQKAEKQAEQAAEKAEEQAQEAQKQAEQAQQQGDQQQQQGDQQQQQATGTLESIDQQQRTLTVSTEEGERLMVMVPEGVSGFEDLNQGDKVNLKYSQGQVSSVSMGGGGQGGGAQQQQQQQGQGNGNGGMGPMTKSGQIVNYDQQENIVEFTDEQGNRYQAKVQDPQVQQKLQQLQPGEQAQFTFTPPQAQSIEKAE